MNQPEEETTLALATAKRAAYAAGSYLMSKLGSAKVERKKASRDELLDVDLEAERMILARLHDAFPYYGILSEEAGQISSNLPIYWIVDPLDGSTNFQHGSHLFGIAIALVNKRQTIASVIYLPARDELFSAIKGFGAFLNDTPIHVSSTQSVDESVIHFGDFSKSGDHRVNSRQLKEINRLADKVTRIRMIGSAAIDLAFVAAGRADALVNH